VTSRRSRHVALLRAINVGGNNELPMAALREIFDAVGFRDVATYLRSGNVAFTAPAAVARRAPAKVAAEIEARFGYDVPVVTRTLKELSAVHAAHPFADRTDDLKRLHVAFLSAAPAADRAIDPDRSPADRFELRGRDLYLFYPNGVARSKLQNRFIERALGVTSTTRGWRTVGKLLAMAER